MLAPLATCDARSHRSTRVAAVPANDSAITPELFTKYQSLIYKEAGIWLAPHKTALLVGRLSRRLRVLGLRTMLEYYRVLMQPDQQHERALMIDCITTNETHFFRESRHFEFLAQRIFPRWKRQADAGQRPRHIRVWSAGCSSGEEPYSLAMLLLKHFGDADWNLEVLATDISTRVLEKAQMAIFPIEKSKQIPSDYLHAYMLKGRGEQEGFMKAGPEVQRLVRFSRVNLNADAYPVNGLFDLILCRNVLIYFDQQSKKKVVDGLVRHLSPHGLLFVGHSENINGISPGIKSVVPTVYAQIQGSEHRADPVAAPLAAVAEARAENS